MIKNQMLGFCLSEPEPTSLAVLCVLQQRSGGFPVGIRRGVVINFGTVLALTALVVASLAVAAPAQNISTVAGGGPPNGLKANAVPVGLPWGVVQDVAGNTYISDKV